MSARAYPGAPSGSRASRRRRWEGPPQHHGGLHGGRAWERRVPPRPRAVGHAIAGLFGHTWATDRDAPGRSARLDVDVDIERHVAPERPIGLGQAVGRIAHG